MTKDFINSHMIGKPEGVGGVEGVNGVRGQLKRLHFYIGFGTQIGGVMSIPFQTNRVI